jgi:hypothetical protein
MNKEEKHELVLALTEQMKEYGNFYITDTSNLTVAKVTISVVNFSKATSPCRLLKIA